MTTYDQTIAWLTSLEITAGWDLKLERMRAALARRGHPEAAFPALHVAGTNGKGSTAAMLDAVLTAAGWTTGLYTSPHLIDFTERIRIRGGTIPRETVVALVDELRADLDAAGIALTHFEFATLLACEWFRQAGVDVAVIEVGLGGRLDATNLVRPVVTAITSIGHDHEEYLGQGLPAIAGEKAGILKAGVPLALGPVAPEAEAVITARAGALGIPVVHAGRQAVLQKEEGTLVFRGAGVAWDGLELGLPGRFQRDNAAVALTVLALARERFSCSASAVREGLRHVRWPGRLAVVRQRPLVVLDGAHNPEGVTTLVGELPALVGTRPVTLVFAVMADKAWREMLASLLPGVARVVATRVGRRALPPPEIAAEVGGRMPVEVVEDPGTAVRVGLERAGDDGAVLIAGSLFLVGRAYTELGVQTLFRAWHPPVAGATQAPL
jgi:dihydrofolate synthase/folylpolyglutamate synthase